MNLGIMCGRLSPPVDNKIQAFPFKSWKNEFKLANNLGLQCIEWVYEHQNKNHNPICSDEGIKALNNLSVEYNININSLVADNFLEDPLFNTTSSAIEESISFLIYLIDQCSKAKIKMLELPLMGSNSIRKKESRDDLRKNILYVLDYAMDKNVQIVFELDLPPLQYFDFINTLDHPAIGVNYDMGNSAMFGFNPKEEITILGKYLCNVHIKDGMKNGGTVPLGKGDTDFNTVFSELKSVNYNGDLIFQTARQDLSNFQNKISPTDTINGYISFIQALPVFK